MTKDQITEDYEIDLNSFYETLETINETNDSTI